MQIKMAIGTLGKDELATMDAYWRAANYLSVGQIYLFDNPLLKRALAARERVLGPARQVVAEALLRRGVVARVAPGPTPSLVEWTPLPEHWPGRLDPVRNVQRLR